MFELPPPSRFFQIGHVVLRRFCNLHFPQIFARNFGKSSGLNLAFIPRTCKLSPVIKVSHHLLRNLFGHISGGSTPYSNNPPLNIHAFKQLVTEQKQKTIALFTQSLCVSRAWWPCIFHFGHCQLLIQN